MGRILLATGGSPSATEALAYAVDLAAVRRSELHVLVVRRPGDEGPEEACSIADRAVGAAADRDVRAIGHVAQGDPAAAIASVAGRLRVEMIVVGDGDRLVPGLEQRVSLGVVRRAGHPVVVVRHHGRAAA